MDSKKEKVYVAMSGGVDSSLSAALLQEATPNNFKKLFGRPTPEGFRGYAVTGVFIKTWHPEFLECTWREEREDAMRVAAGLGIAFKTLDLEAEYKKEVVDYMIAEYKAGRTPNPDVMCNKHIKFGAFFDFAMHEGADKIATGHYTRIASSVEHRAYSGNEEVLNAKRYTLHTGADSAKDQSYFLWTLTQDVLSKTLFPVGEYEKSEVRKMAAERELETAEKKDSQGVCFLGEVDMKSFLSRYIEQKQGDVLNDEGQKIGTHDGAFLYTIGQRHGFDVPKKSPYENPYYVVAKDVTANTITVASTPADLNKHVTKEVVLRDTNWITDAPDIGGMYQARIRYRQPLQPCTVTEINIPRSEARIRFVDGQRAVTPGQSLVLYKEEVCLGGGVIV